jgi:SAM-dependent methyltransferase
VITGERVSAPEGGFNPTFQRHVAAYRLSAPLLPEGRVLDVGCGTGHSFDELAPRETVGVDCEASALAGQKRETHVADMRQLPFPDASFASVISVHSIEHVPDPDRALAEIARVLVPGARAVLVTPNRLTFGIPDEIIAPYHYVEYSPAELRAECDPWFANVEVLGLFGSPRYMALVDAEQRELEHLLRLDPLRLRRFVPRRVRQRLFDARLRASRAVPAPGALDIAPEDFHLAPGPLDAALDLVAVCDRA